MRPLPKRAARIKGLAKKTAQFFKEAGAQVAPRVVDWYEQLGKAEGDDKQPDWSKLVPWAALVAMYEQELKDAALASGNVALGQVSDPDYALPEAMGAGSSATPSAEVIDDLGAAGEAAAINASVTQGEYVASMANYYGQSRAAELVGMRFTANGTLEPNPDASLAISESTRSMLQADIEDAVAQHLTADELAAMIKESYAFSQARADLIAQYELDSAHMALTLQGWKASGQVTGKYSEVSPEHTELDECDDNEAAGVIPLEGAFPSGDYGRPFHLRCMCNVYAVRVQPDQPQDPGELGA